MRVGIFTFCYPFIQKILQNGSPTKLAIIYDYEHPTMLFIIEDTQFCKIFCNKGKAFDPHDFNVALSGRGCPSDFGHDVPQAS